MIIEGGNIFHCTWWSWPVGSKSLSLKIIYILLERTLRTYVHIYIYKQNEKSNKVFKFYRLVPHLDTK